MPGRKQQFFDAQSFVVIGNSRTKGFPTITYGNLRRLGKTVYAVDLAGAPLVSGDRAYPSIAEIPNEVTAAIIELPREEVMAAVEQVAAAKIATVWLHQNSETDAAVRYCRNQMIDYHTGGCAVMYTNNRFSYHSVHKKLWKLLGKY